MSNCEFIATSIANAVTVSGVSRAFLYGEIQNGRLQIRKAGRRSLIEIVGQQQPDTAAASSMDIRLLDAPHDVGDEQG